MGGAGGATEIDCEAASDLMTVPPLLTQGCAAEPEAVRFNACICCAAGNWVRSPAHSLSMLSGGPAADEYDATLEEDEEEGGLPRDSWPRFSSSCASSDEEHEAAAAAVAVHDAAEGGAGSKGGVDHIIVRTPPISPISTEGGGRGGAGVALCVGGFMLSPVD